MAHQHGLNYCTQTHPSKGKHSGKVLQNTYTTELNENSNNYNGSNQILKKRQDRTTPEVNHYLFIIR